MPSSGSNQEDEGELALDASAFYSGIAFLSGAAKCVTTSAVFEEIKHVKAAALDALVQAGYLRVIDPDSKSIDMVFAAAKRTGDSARLSPADVSILALALERKAVLASDDYAVANVAATLRVKVAPSSGKGIRETRRYIAYCSACGKAFAPEKQECPLCGNRLKRRYKKKKAVTV
ncbi:MAG TPA: NOB1 family endonuclease [Nitrososphaera sp.]|nr:NOB1 family endonuclease [Nitrososphaera sp.]